MPASVAATLRDALRRIVAGLKDSQRRLQAVPGVSRRRAETSPITVGNEADIARAIAEGGAGTICGMANVACGLVQAHDQAAPARKRG